MQTKPRRRLALLAFMGWDVMIAVAAFVLAAGSAENHSWLALPSWILEPMHLVFIAVAMAVWHFLLLRRQLYNSRRLVSADGESRDLLIGVAQLIAAVAVGAIVVSPDLADREFLVRFFFSLSIALIASRIVLRRLLRRIREQGRNLRSVLLVGSGHRAAWLIRKFAMDPSLGYRVLGFVDDRVQGGLPWGTPHLGSLDHLRDLLSTSVIDEVFVALPMKSYYERIQRVVADCELQGVPVTLMSDFFSTRLARTDFALVGDSPAMRLSNGLETSPQAAVKRYLDFGLAAVALLVLSPLLLVVAILIKLTSPGPVIFAQTRTGLNKRPFTLYKFRTMIADAESKQADLEYQNEASGPVFKIRQDPRVTPLGGFLRKASIDELPQLFNVLKGDMSLVGPRPLPLRDVAGFQEDWQRRRFSVLPGITCLWQLSGRSDVSFDRWMELDLEYIDNWSLALDFAILVRTIKAVVRREGAY
jgi:exopolysaccharide biosynthesis polyprenyl glycosylphosphotransferase